MVFEYQDYRNTPPRALRNILLFARFGHLHISTLLEASCPCCLFPISHACHPLPIAPISMIGISPPSSKDSCLVSDPTTPQCPLGHVLNWSAPVSLGLLSALPETSYSTSTLFPRSSLKRLLCRVAFLYHWPHWVGCFTDCHGSRACTVLPAIRNCVTLCISSLSFCLSFRLWSSLRQELYLAYICVPRYCMVGIQ